jgi:hypothetical protein
MSRRRLLWLCLALAPSAHGEGLPLPEAPVRLVIPDPAAFDKALSGSFRNALQGEAAAEDPGVAAFRQSPVGSKLEAQWEKLSGDLPWTWKEIRQLRPSRVGLALLSVGNLEAVIVVETPLAVLPASLPPGTAKSHGGVAYHLVSPGAGDEARDPVRRAGLAWAQRSGALYLATSERGLLLALDAPAGVVPGLDGLVSLDLDLDALARDRYFRREFLPGPPGDRGHVRAALRLEGGNLVEVREGSGEPGSPALVFDAPGAAAAGWEPDGASFFNALRSGLLEPLASLSDTPVPSLEPLPVTRPATDDRLLVNFEKPRPAAGQSPADPGELAQWGQLLHAQPVEAWGYLLGREGERRLVFRWPSQQDDRLIGLCRATLERRSGPSTLGTVGDIREIRVGPDLPALALRRVGEAVWIGPSAASLKEVPPLRPGGDVVRWAILDLEAVRAEAPRWRRAEGPANPDRIRPFSDRVLGVLGWMPRTRTLSVERRKTAGGWSERVVLGAAP